MEKKVVIFVSNDFGASVIWGDKKDENGETVYDKDGNPKAEKLAEFHSLFDNIQQVTGVNQRVGQATWVCVKPDNTPLEHRIIERLRKHPEIDIAFYESSSMPEKAKITNLKQLGNKAGQEALQTAINVEKVKLEEEKKALKGKMKRYAELSNQVQKAGGEIVKDADPALVEEFNKLKVELEIEDEKTNP